VAAEGTAYACNDCKDVEKNWQLGQGTDLGQVVRLPVGAGREEFAEKSDQEMKQQPTRIVSSLSCLVQRRFKLTRTGGRMGTWSTASSVSGTFSVEGKSSATPPKPRSTTRARWTDGSARTA